MLSSVAVLAAFPIAVATEPLQTWKEYSPPGAGFSVQLPAKPQQKTQASKAMKINSYSCASKRQHLMIVFIATYSEKSDQVEGLKRARAFATGILSNLDSSAPVGIPKNSKPAFMTRSGVTGEETVFSQFRNDVFGRLWVGYTDTQVFGLLAGIVAKSRETANTSIDKFFGSFKLIKE